MCVHPSQQDELSKIWTENICRLVPEGIDLCFHCRKMKVLVVWRARTLWCLDLLDRGIGFCHDLWQNPIVDLISVVGMHLPGSEMEPPVKTLQRYMLR